jgi:septal ring factor EnvC (AmiA/AmiB activator)
MLSIGSVPSLILHTCFFSLFFIAAWLQVFTIDFALLVLTTLVSLEAIYMAIFIQMAVNRNTQSLYEVEEDIEEIQEDVGEIQEDVGEIQEDVAEVQENMDEIQEEILDEQEDLFGNKIAPSDDRGTELTLDRIGRDLERLLRDIDALKEKK